MPTLTTQPLTRAAFAPFGQVIDTGGAAPLSVNDGRAERFHDLARIEFAGPHPRPLLSIFRSKPVAMPYTLTFLERHPLGSQAFHPLSPRPFLVIVAPDDGGVPGTPLAFVTAPGQGVNYATGTWHGALAPLDEVSEFLIIDRGGDGNNLEIHTLETPVTVTLG